MCGILGVILKDNKNESFVDDKFFTALMEIHHRGPDDNGFRKLSISGGKSLYLGHTRLSILDLSDAGHQPMSMGDDSLTIIFNGEIYNYKELREELETIGYLFVTQTDTEVLLKAFHQWGLEVLPRLVGMFSFCIYDQRRAKITLVRDPFGIKPLYIKEESDRIIFSSEIPALLALAGQQRRPDVQAAYDYLVHRDYGSSDRTFFSGVQQLMPASYIEVDLIDSVVGDQSVWWRPSIAEDKSISFDDAVLKVRELFLNSVRLHMRSDVQIGAALSGGIDSSAIVCAMRFIEPDIPIHTFSYISPGPKSEEKWVDLVNSYTKSIGAKITSDPEELMADLDNLIRSQGEPFGTTSIYAQYRVFKIAKDSGVVVTLDGQGADELLAGYNGYPGERLLSLFEEKKINAAFSFARYWSVSTASSYWLGWMYLGRIILPTKIYQIARKYLGRDYEPKWLNLNMMRSAGVKIYEKRSKLEPAGKGRRVIEKLRSSVWNRGLPTLLRHADRNSMSFSIESRVPFLTIDMAEYLFSLPEEYLISKTGETKYIFRRAMEGILPEEIVKRQDKIGFEMESNSWQELYVEELSKTDKSKLTQLIDFDLAMREGKSANEEFYWRLLNYLKWYNLFFDSCVEDIGKCK